MPVGTLPIGSPLAVTPPAGPGTGISLNNGTSPIPGNPHSTVNLYGLTAVDLGSGVASLTTSPGVNFEDNGSPVSGSPFATTNVTGGATVTNVGGVATLNVPLPTDLNIPGQTTGDVIYFNGSHWVRLALGTTGQVLEAGTHPQWITLPLPTDLNLPSEATGSIAYYNGTHWVSLAVGSNGSLLNVATGEPAWLGPSTNGFVLTMVGGVPAWSALSIPLPTDLNLSGESTGALAYYNGTHWVSLGAGGSSTFLGISGGIPTWQAVPGSSMPGLNFQGNGTPLAGSPYATGNFVGLTVTNVGGVATVTLPANLGVSGATAGDITYFNGTNWVRLAEGTANTFLKTGAAPSWSALPLPTDLNLSGEATGSVAYYNGSHWVSLGVGSNGSVLEVSSGEPTWLAPGSNGTFLTMVSGAPVWQVYNPNPSLIQARLQNWTKPIYNALQPGVVVAGAPYEIAGASTINTFSWYDVHSNSVVWDQTYNYWVFSIREQTVNTGSAMSGTFGLTQNTNTATATNDQTSVLFPGMVLRFPGNFLNYLVTSVTSSEFTFIPTYIDATQPTASLTLPGFVTHIAASLDGGNTITDGYSLGTSDVVLCAATATTGGSVYMVTNGSSHNRTWVDTSSLTENAFGTETQVSVAATEWTEAGGGFIEVSFSTTGAHNWTGYAATTGQFGGFGDISSSLPAFWQTSSTNNPISLFSAHSVVNGDSLFALTAQNGSTYTNHLLHVTVSGGFTVTFTDISASISGKFDLGNVYGGPVYDSVNHIWGVLNLNAFGNFDLWTAPDTLSVASTWTKVFTWNAPLAVNTLAVCGGVWSTVVSQGTGNAQVTTVWTSANVQGGSPTWTPTKGGFTSDPNNYYGNLVSNNLPNSATVGQHQLMAVSGNQTFASWST